MMCSVYPSCGSGCGTCSACLILTFAASGYVPRQVKRQLAQQSLALALGRILAQPFREHWTHETSDKLASLHIHGCQTHHMITWTQGAGMLVRTTQGAACAAAVNRKLQNSAPYCHLECSAHSSQERGWFVEVVRPKGCV